jgi:hypothetical protein
MLSAAERSRNIWLFFTNSEIAKRFVIGNSHPADSSRIRTAFSHAAKPPPLQPMNDVSSELKLSASAVILPEPQPREVIPILTFESHRIPPEGLVKR